MQERKRHSRGIALSESISDQKIVISDDPSPRQEKIVERNTMVATESRFNDKTGETATEASSSRERIVDRKTIVYETLVDPTVIKVTGEKLKTQLFSRLGFFKPNRADIQFVSINKYYEPYVVIAGKYAIDYYRKSAYTVKLDKEVREVILLNQQFEPGQSIDSYGQSYKTIRLDGEERIMKEFNASLILDRSGEDVTLERLPSAPSERNPEKILTEFGAEEIPEDEDLHIIQSKILKRPNDINRVVNELFEVNERVVIYTPRYRLLYRNLGTGEERAMEFDGVTAKRIFVRTYVRKV